MHQDDIAAGSAEWSTSAEVDGGPTVQYLPGIDAGHPYDVELYRP